MLNQEWSDCALQEVFGCRTNLKALLSRTSLLSPLNSV